MAKSVTSEDRKEISDREEGCITYDGSACSCDFDRSHHLLIGCASCGSSSCAPPAGATGISMKSRHVYMHVAVLFHICSQNAVPHLKSIPVHLALFISHSLFTHAHTRLQTRSKRKREVIAKVTAVVVGRRRLLPSIIIDCMIFSLFRNLSQTRPDAKVRSLPYDPNHWCYRQLLDH